MEDCDYSCTLFDETVNKAKEELGEDPETRLDAVRSLRTKLESIPAFKPRADAPFLLAFLRARKFNEERTFQLIKNFYETKKNGVEFFGGLKPSVIKHVIDDGVIDVLKERDVWGCRVVILRAGHWDPDKYPMTDIPRTLFLVLSRLLKEEETQVHGVHFINDLVGTSWRHARHVSPSSTKYFMKILQDVLPLRMKKMDYIHEPTFFDVIYAVIKQFMKEKLTKRVGLYGDKLEYLQASIKPEHLPSDLGGMDEPFANKEWMDEFLQSDAEVEEEDKFGFLDVTDSLGRNENNVESTGSLGLQGIFKKLNL